MDINIVNSVGYGQDILWVKNLTKIDFKFNGNMPICDYAIVTAINNGKKGIFLMDNGIVTIEQELLNIGQLLLTIDYYVGTNKIGTCQCEPITIRLEYGQYELVPEIANLRQEIADLRESNNQLQQSYNKVCDLIKALYDIDIKEVGNNE